MIEVTALFFAVMLCFTCMVFTILLLIEQRGFPFLLLAILNVVLLVVSIQSLLQIAPF